MIEVYVSGDICYESYMELNILHSIMSDSVIYIYRVKPK